MTRRGRMGVVQVRRPAVRRAAGLWTPAQLAPFAWYREDVVGSAPVTQWTDKAGSLQLTQAAGGPTLVAADADLANAQTLHFNSDFLDAATASDWTFLHNGSGVFFWAVVRQIAGTTQMAVFDSCRSTSANVGCLLFTSGGNITLFIARGGSLTVSLATTGGLWTNGANHLVSGFYSETGSPKVAIWLNGTLRASTSTTNAPSAAAPIDPIRVGARSGSLAFHLDAKVPELGFCKTASNPSATDIASLYAYAKTRYGVP
jgi:hypothetical protein